MANDPYDWAKKVLFIYNFIIYSNDTLKASYLNCMFTLAVKCPAQYSDVAASLLDKLNTFCDGKNVSQWIQSGMLFFFSILYWPVILTSTLI